MQNQKQNKSISRGKLGQSSKNDNTSYGKSKDGAIIFRKKNNGDKAVNNEVHFNPADPKNRKKISYRSKLEKNPKIALADSDAEVGLDLFCYTKCDNFSPLQVKRARGLVFDGDNLVLKTFPYTDEYSIKDTESMDKFVKPHFSAEGMKENRFFRSYEGSLIRVFNHKAKWYITTHRKLDAFKSKWSSNISFGEMFLNALKEIFFADVPIPADESEPTFEQNLLEHFFSMLSENKSYMFLVLPNEQNRVVCQAPEKPTVFHVGTYENFPSDVFSLDDDIGIPHPEEYHFKTFEEMEETVNSLDYNNSQGIILFGPKKQQIKVLNDDYYYYFNVRGNEPSIKFRYLQIRSDPKERWRDLGVLYPDHIPHFKEYEGCLERIAIDIYSAYVRRYIKKEKIVVPPEEFQVMRKCQGWYIENPKTNKVSQRIVTEALDWESPTALNRMIKRLKLEDRKMKEKEHLPETETKEDFPELVPNKEKN